MPTATLVVKFDKDEDGTPEEDITAYLPMEQTFQALGFGRRKDLDAADNASLNFRLENKDGRFTPKNTGSPYYPNFKAGRRISVQVVWNSVTYDFFYGKITELDLRPMVADQTVHLKCEGMMQVLERTDVRPSLMRDHYTGVIIHRLLDYGEKGELVSNPLFKDDATRYSGLNSGTFARVTDDPILEGGAALEVTSPAGSLSGVRCDVTDLTAAGQKVTVAAYLEALAGSSSAFKVTLSDDVQGDDFALGAAKDLSDALDDFDRWPAVTGTFHTSSTARYIDIHRSSAAGSEQTFRLGAVHACLATAALARAIDHGKATLEYFAPHRGRVLDLIQEVRDNELGGLFLFDEAGRAVFEQRDHRWYGDHVTSQVTIDEKFTAMKYEELLSDRVDELVLDYPHYLTGELAQVWSADRVPIAIGPSAVETIEIDFEGGLVRDMVKPVANTDYFVNSMPDGSGVDESGNVTLDWSDFGGGAQARFTNTVARTVYLTSLRVRARAVREATDRTPVRATAAAGPKESAVVAYNYGLNSSRRQVQSWGGYLADRHGPQMERLEIEIDAPWPIAATSTLIGAILARKVSDRITFTNDGLPFSSKEDGDFYIDSLDRVIDGNAGRIYATYTLVPVDAAMMIWDTSSWGAAVWSP